VGALVGIAVMGILLDTTDDWYRGAALCFAAMGGGYLLSALLAWRFVRPVQDDPVH
jgi:DHA2 family methylenomycin A resistance protein-like MFS transporter